MSIQPNDNLRMDYINSLPQPFVVKLLGDKTFMYGVHDIDVESATLRIDVCGLLQVISISEVVEFRDDQGNIHDPDTFWVDYEPVPPTNLPTTLGEKNVLV